MPRSNSDASHKEPTRTDLFDRDANRHDPMTWASASEYLRAAGWDLKIKEGGPVELAFGNGAHVGQILDHVPADDESVDGHGLIRTAGAGNLDAALADSVESDILVDEVLVGLNWTLVRAGAFAGIARSPERGTGGARTVRKGEPIAGRPLSALAQWLCSLDPLRRSIGLAAVNAFWNRSEGPQAQGGWGFAGFSPPGDDLIIIGGFRGAQKRLPAARIIEREPKGNDIPADRADEALAIAGSVAITAQTLMNGSLEPLLAKIGKADKRLLVGPSTPVAPQVLDAGLTRVSGLAVTDVEAVAQFIKETGTMIALDHMTKQLELAK
ncbi:MAG: DUF364 domain-containing protein [Pseudomonadota bacterium]